MGELRITHESRLMRRRKEYKEWLLAMPVYVRNTPSSSVTTNTTRKM
jgi:hypothetical protein